MKKLLHLGETIHSSSMLQNALCRGCPLRLHPPCLLPFPAIRGRSAPASKTVTNLLTLFLLLPLLLLCCFQVSFQPKKKKKSFQCTENKALLGNFCVSSHCHFAPSNNHCVEKAQPAEAQVWPAPVLL